MRSTARVPATFRPSMLLGCVVALLAFATSCPAKQGYLRYPDLHGDTVIFCAEGDLWTVPVSGGVARHFTSHPGVEYFPRFSPDGRHVAFTAEYDGNSDVFVVPSVGGEPARLTWAPGADEVIGWTPDGKEILFRSRRGAPHGDWQIYAVPPSGGDPRLLPIGRASRLSIDSESGMWALNRTDRERATWKRYRGGTAADVWVGRPGEDFRRVTEFEGHDMMPLWSSGRIWFASDQGGTQELWSMRPDGSDRTRHTDHGDWDIRYPEGDGGRIVYMVAGDIGLYDIASGKDARLSVDLPSEAVRTRQRYPDASKYLTEFDLSPDGDRLAIVSRGEIFSVPAEKGVTTPVTSGSGARERGAVFDHEGKRIFFVSDATREEDIRSIDAWGRGEARVEREADKTGWLFGPSPSPNGKWIAWADETQTLWAKPLPRGNPVRVDRSEQGEIRQYVWSHDGRYLAYVKLPRTEFSSIFVWDSFDQKTHRVTGDATIDFSPAWDPDGRWLAFLSARTVNPVLDTGRDFQNLDLLTTKPYLVMLKADAKSPFEKQSGLPDDEKKKGEKDENGDKKGDDEDEKGKGKGKGKKDENGEKEKPKPVEIEWDGLDARIVEVPIEEAGILDGLGATSDHLYWLSRAPSGIESDEDEEQPSADLVSFDLEEEEEKVFAEGVTTYDLEPTSGKIAFAKKKGEIYVVDAAAEAPGELEEKKVPLDDIVIDLDPREEWRQMFYEGWRNMRDFHWTADMAGVNWTSVRDQYGALLPRLGIRDDLRDLMGEMIGELSTSHTYVWGGDSGVELKGVPTGLLGGRFVREDDAYRIEKIYRGDPVDIDRSPLHEPGVNVREGEYIVAANRRPFRKGLPFEAAFENLAGREVVLTVASTSLGRNPREVVVTPIDNDQRLRYIDWVRTNREKVAAATGGKVGYLHIPNMGAQGLIEFNRWFYPQLDKEGMVVDCRWNGGGFVSQMMVERFRRKVLSWDRARGGGVFTYPYRTLNGPFVVLTNEQAGSDGDIFPYAVQMEGLAPVIGERSWGGVVGIRGDKNLVDGGALTQPEYAWWDPRRGWAMENHGVDPDIVVVDTPQACAKGEDPQLDRGIREVMRLMKERPAQRPLFEGEIPDKSRAGYRAREATISR